ncbi:MAG: FTR1 family protein [Gammaproteobacteria bacterium]|nr:FTR1 family protein [Gammaproteobacteria bacterium]
MLLSSVIIILREVLEGAILMSVLLALSSLRGINLRWSLISLLFGIIGALIYAAEFETISTWFDYVGQEIVNSTMHVIIVLFLTSFALLYQTHEQSYTKTKNTFMIIVVALTIVREGSEILLYFSGYLDKSDVLPSVILGGTIGTGIGMSIGALLYYSLTYLIPTHAKKIAYILLAFFSAGMLAHAVTMLTQADWLPARHILWNTSSWLEENSLMGQLLYAIIGYEATPTATQLTAYVIGLLLLLALPKLLEKGITIHAKNK